MRRGYPLAINYVKRCLNVYGREITKSKGIKTGTNSSKIKEMELILLPVTLIETHSTESLVMDYLCVQGIPLHHNISKSHKFRTIEALKGKMKPSKKDVSG